MKMRIILVFVSVYMMAFCLQLRSSAVSDSGSDSDQDRPGTPFEMMFTGASQPQNLSANGPVASNANFYTFTFSLPNSDYVTEFGTARDDFMTSVSMSGYPTGTRSRVGQVTGIEIRDSFDPGDMTVSVSHLWRAQFGPPAPYDGQYGQRVYCGVLIVKSGSGKVSLDRVSYIVTCAGIPLLNNQSSLAGLPYSVSRIGIDADSNGNLFAPGSFIDKTSGGTNQHDAILFIGGRIGALVNNEADYVALDNEIGTNGTTISFRYLFQTTNHICSSTTVVPLFERHMIPMKFAHLAPFICPNGVLFSISGPMNSSAMTLQTRRNLNKLGWATVTTVATEGTSTFIEFTRNPTNDMGFARIYFP